MADVTAKLAYALRDCLSMDIHHPSCKHWKDRSRAILAAYEQAQAEPKQAAEPFAYVDRVSLLWLSDEARTPLASIETSLYKTAPGDGWVGVYLAAPVAQAATPAPADPIGYMNAGHLQELKAGRLPYGYVYPEEAAGAHVPVFAATPAPEPQPLTDGQIEAAVRGAGLNFTQPDFTVARSVERARAFARARAVERACAEAWGVKLTGQGKEASK